VLEANKGQRRLGRTARKRGGSASKQDIADDQIGVRRLVIVAGKC
jgi:hypothetical protein